MLSRWLLGKNNKIYIILLPFLLLMINLSIHVYYEYSTFLEVLKDTESVISLIVGFIVGLIVALISVKKIRDYQIKNFLNHLKNCTPSYAPSCNTFGEFYMRFRDNNSAFLNNLYS